MARRTSSGAGTGAGYMAPVLSIATGLLVFVVLIIFAPTIASSIEEAQPDFGTTCSYVNTSSSVEFTGACGATATDTAYTYNVAESPDALWNPDYNADLPSGVTTWQTNIQILGVVILIISIAVAMGYLKNMA